MLAIGLYHTLTVLERRGDALLLGNGADCALLPVTDLPPGTAIGDRVRVFVHTGSDGTPVATTRTPHAIVGEFACCHVVDVSPHGAFLDWGLAKDLFVPFREQHRPMAVGERHVVAVYLDERTNRVVGTSRLGKHFGYDASALREGQEVRLLVYGFNGLGTQVVVENRYAGLVYESETFRPLAVGDVATGWVRRVRDDGKLDVTLQRLGREAAVDAQAILVARLLEAGGTLPLHDKSPPAEIARVLAMSKNTFKKAVGGLYKAGRLALLPDGIALTHVDGR